MKTRLWRLTSRVVRIPTAIHPTGNATTSGREREREKKDQGKREKGRKGERGKKETGREAEEEEDEQVKKNVTDWTVVTRNQRQKR